MSTTRYKRPTKERKYVLITPVFLFGSDGLVSDNVVKNGTDLEIYYEICNKLLDHMDRVPAYMMAKMNIVIKDHYQYPEETLYRVLIILRDALVLFDNLKIHFYDEENAVAEEII